MNIKKKLFKKEFIHRRKKAFTRAPASMSIGTMRGFTFIEVMVVATIIGIMTGVALVSTNSARVNKALEVAGQEVAATIREAQNYALTGKNAGSSCGNVYIFSYGAPTLPANDEYGISGCRAAAHSLKNGVVFLNSNWFSFSVPHGAVDFTGLETIILGKNGKQIRVCVYDSGRIEETAVGGACPP